MNRPNDTVKLLAVGTGIVVFALSAVCALVMVFNPTTPATPATPATPDAAATPATPDAAATPAADASLCAVETVMGGPGLDGTEPPDTGFRLRNCPPSATPYCSSLPGEYMLCFPAQPACEAWQSQAPEDLPAAVPCYPAPEWIWCIDLPARRCFPSARACSVFRRRSRDSLHIEAEATCVRRHAM